MNTPCDCKSIRGYPVREEVWTIAGRSLRLVWPADMDALLDSAETHERFRRDEYMPYWAQPWPASILLAVYVLEGESGAGRRAVEIGCGIGLVSLAAGLAGWQITATDYDADAVAFAEVNARRNGIALAATAVLDYRKPLESPRYDLILGSDLLYERQKSEPVARWIASALNPGGVALLSDPNRTAAEGFPSAAASRELKTEVLARETASPSGLVARGRIYRVKSA